MNHLSQYMKNKLAIDPLEDQYDILSYGVVGLILVVNIVINVSVIILTHNDIMQLRAITN